MRRALVATVICASATVGCLSALLLPIHMSRGENCGSAYFAAAPPGDDDSWYSTCADLRDRRRGDFTLPAVLSAAALIVSGSLAVRRHRELVLGFAVN